MPGYSGVTRRARSGCGSAASVSTVPSTKWRGKDCWPGRSPTRWTTSNGRLFLDRLGVLKRDLIVRKLRPPHASRRLVAPGDAGAGAGGGTEVERLRVVFLGTSTFAVPVLSARCTRATRVLAAVTQPDRPAGPQPPPARQPDQASGAGTRDPGPATGADPPPERLGTGGGALEPDVLVVADYGQILPARLLAVPRGWGPSTSPPRCFPNSAAPLPRSGPWPAVYRRTGVTTMLMDAGLDTGPILLQRETEVGATPKPRVNSLPGSLPWEPTSSWRPCPDSPADGSLRRNRQDDEAATLRAPGSGRADAALDWELEAPGAGEPGCAPSPPTPVAFTAVRRGERPGQSPRFGSTAPQPPTVCRRSGQPPGSFRIAGSRSAPRLVVACGGGTALLPLEVQAAGRRRLPVAQFLRGNAVPPAGRFAGAAEAARLAESG